MMKYIFFDIGLRDRFVEHAKGFGVACDLRDATWDGAEDLAEN